MAKIDLDLPPHCQIRQRKGYADVYFIVHPKDRPEGWRPTIHLGRTDRAKAQDIAKAAQETYQSFLAFKGLIETDREKPGTICDVCDKYLKSNAFLDNSLRVRKDYNYYLKEIRSFAQSYGNPHMEKLTPPVIVKFLNRYEDRPRKQQMMKIVLRNVCSIAVMEGHLAVNPVTRDIKLRKRQTQKREIVIWSEDDVDRFVAECDRRGLPSLGSIALTMIETAQRKGDVINMRTGVDYKDGELAYVQSKTGKTVYLRATDKLKARYRQLENNYYMFVNEKTGQKWNEHTVAHKAREILDALGMSGYRLMELRHSQVNYLYEIGCTTEEITACTGHERPETMRKHYREKLNKKRADSAVVRINSYRKKKASHTN